MWRAVVEGRSVEEGAPCRSGAGAKGQHLPWATCCSQLRYDEDVPADSWAHSGLAPVHKKYNFLCNTYRQRKLYSFQLRST